MPGDRTSAHTGCMTPVSSSSAGTLWRICIALFVPKYAPTAADGGPAAQLSFNSRIDEQSRQYGDILVAIRKPSDGRYVAMYGDNPQIEVVELIADVPAGPDTAVAIEKFGPVFATLIDLMSFEMATTLGLGGMTIVDITPPVSVGDERSLRTFASPPFDPYERAVEMQAVQGALLGQLPDSADVGNSKTAATLRWFVKSLATNLLHDQFIFLWIALEILCDASDVKIVEPYVGPCQHEIANCPVCHEPTTRLVRGATLRAFLENAGISESQSKELWNMRQLMHGAIRFDSKKLANLGPLVQPLRAVVAAELKTKLGKQEDDAPIVAGAGLTFHPSVTLEGTRKINEDDIHPLMLA
jgi:hypothetical protein